MSKKHDDASRNGSARDAGIRGLRIEELFREEINSILDSEVSDPRLDGTRVTLIELSRDGSRARIWFAVMHNRGPKDIREVEKAFARASAFLRSRLCEALALKRMPELRFRYDPAAVIEPTDPQELK
jgi:ribosome-binding factor A